jgi:hypothetical protein
MSDSARTLPERGERDDPRAPATLFVGALSFLLLIAIAVGLDALHRLVAEREHARKVVAVEPRARVELEAAQRRRLADYRWIDRGAGRLAIPVERAVELLAAESAASAGPTP